MKLNFIKAATNTIRGTISGLASAFFQPTETAEDKANRAALSAATGLDWKIAYDRGMNPAEDRKRFVVKIDNSEEATAIKARLNSCFPGDAPFTTRQPVNPHSFEALPGLQIILPADRYSPELIEALKNPQTPNESPASYVTSRNIM